MRSSSSGCQSTPSANGGPGISIASTIPSPGAAADLDALADPIDALVMVRLDRGPLGAGGARRERVRARSSTSWSPNTPGVCRCVSEAVDVLLERAAAGDVQHLHPAADPEHRHVALQRAARQRGLEAVAVGVRAASSPDAGRRRSSPGRRRSRPPGSEPSSMSSSCVGVVGDRVVGREHQGDRARALDRQRVVARREQHKRLPRAPARASRSRRRCRLPDAASG